MNNKDNKSNKELTEKEKEYLENTLCTFIFGVLGCLIPVFLFSLISMHYARKHGYEPWKKLHKIGEKLGTIGIVMSGLAIVLVAIINYFG